MKFSYASYVSGVPSSGEFIILRRPEIPITISGPSGTVSFMGLVDTGSDHTIFPKSVADYLDIPVDPVIGSAASVFGGQRVRLSEGEAILKLESEGQSLLWKTMVCFFPFAAADEETVILGHASFLDYFSATFDGKSGILTLSPNDELPVLE